MRFAESCWLAENIVVLDLATRVLAELVMFVCPRAATAAIFRRTFSALLVRLRNTADSDTLHQMGLQP